MHKTKLVLALASQSHLSVEIDPSFAVIEVLIKEKKRKKLSIKKLLWIVYRLFICKTFYKKILKMYLFSFKACHLYYASICLSLY